MSAPVDVYSAHRIVHGTDSTAFGRKWSIDAIAKAELTDIDKAAILHGDAAAVLEPLIGVGRVAAELGAGSKSAASTESKYRVRIRRRQRKGRPSAAPVSPLNYCNCP